MPGIFVEMYMILKYPSTVPHWIPGKTSLLMSFIPWAFELYSTGLGVYRTIINTQYRQCWKPLCWNQCKLRLSLGTTEPFIRFLQVKHNFRILELVLLCIINWQEIHHILSSWCKNAPNYLYYNPFILY